MVIINRWLAMTAQIGLTGHCYLGNGWTASTMKRISAIAGPEVYLRPWDTQIALRGGRFVYGDYGVELEGFRHFRHVSVGVYGSYSNKGKENAGFKVVVMLPLQAPPPRGQLPPGIGLPAHLQRRGRKPRQHELYDRSGGERAHRMV